ncbi:class I SAM-dependent methyltransferase [Kribbella italica]|uniref:SAM-dependent methyltransferase n=1 Tax=Kribbella italica TaxID=1540520 RepID=A0A7W9J992_9ACTN|nr:class I SAM-dependent methyltransferase [Kribbella italica]MBB5837505.1 SAM-dependent methyltransferase [Kribbella italica]
MEHAEQLARVYGPTTWDLYAELDRSLAPRGPDWLLTKASEYLKPGDVVLDAGCRDAAHLIQLVRDNNVTGYGVDPVPLHIARAQEAVDAADLTGRIALQCTGMEEAPALGEQFDLVWCRDVLEQVADLPGALAGVSQVLKPAGHLLVFTQVATELLDAQDTALLGAHLGNVLSNLDPHTLETAFGQAGFAIEEKVVIGTEWREYAEERTQPVSRALLRLARLRRTRDQIVAVHGQDVYEHVEANLHWEVFQFLGKLAPTVDVLRRR